MGFGKSKGFTPGKASERKKRWTERSDEHSTSTRAANESAAHLEAADELIQLSLSHVCQTSTEAVLKMAKEPGRPAVTESLEQAKRKKWNVAYYKRKIAYFARPPIEGLADAAYSKTKTGKPRKGTEASRANAKSRAVAKITNVLTTIGDEAQQGQALRDFSESTGGKRIAKAAWPDHLPKEAVETAVYHQGQVHLIAPFTLPLTLKHPAYLPPRCRRCCSARRA